MTEEKIPNEKPLPDLSELFDLHRTKAVANYVHRFEDLILQRDAISEDIRQLAAEAKEAMFSPIEIAAMKDIARWKTNDSANHVAAKLAALRRVSNVMKVDLFSWADEHIKETGP